ncbi:MAG: cell division/cell wall cluster transcriptional repressor MraZ [Candidatus Spechtbacteria bacterium RIFCSPLOWO2_02_FULL_38_8]|uniref:Transcriptional regulator MraZ n=1 Tax=Candidatus Spechtbacteria bacterium RIFCSPLOWO2_02_FULL_38_8 TaxID=1802164 RepID=A0A1G2HKX0_9BACT|nr:MAG: cell division/cell wall cluster transcriptional repressor MraZ [Candidatus Spechtbacteria bacterium RIFCSPLOWO2_02_FULL_38_8]
MFLGEYQYNLDAKKRVAIPAKFRGDVGKKVVITRGLDNCLFVFTQNEWKKLADKLGALPLGQKDARGFSRLMLAGAMEAYVDGLGRVLIPDYLKDYAMLKKQVIVAGLYNRLEIWDSKQWDLYKQKAERSAGDMAERLGELGV